MTNWEATEAERLAYKNGTVDSSEADGLVHYVAQLKAFLLFLRYGLYSTAIRNLDLSHFVFVR
jgi:hypothetical protein